MENWEIEFDNNWGHLVCSERMSKCDCTEEEHNVKSQIIYIKDFIRNIIKEEKEKLLEELRNN